MVKKRYAGLLALSTAIFLIFSSCSNILGSGGKSENPETGPVLDKNIAYISVNIADASNELISRTVMPSFGTDLSGFKKFELTGSLNDSSNAGSASVNMSWQTYTDSQDEVHTAISQAQGATVPLPLVSTDDPDSFTESWTFTLIGYFGGDSDENATVYKAEVTSNTITVGESAQLSFSLKRISSYNFSSSDTGTINFPLTFANGNTVAKVKAELYAITESGAREQTYTYSISYKNGSSDFTAWGTNADSTTFVPPSTFSRHNAVTLPKVENLDSEFAATNLFLGWYNNSEFTGEPVTNIQPNTTVQNLTLYGKFVNVNEMPTVQGVTFKYDESEEATTSNLKVGHKLTATPYYLSDLENEASKTTFLGTISQWKWYYGSNGNWTQITTGIETSEGGDVTDSTPASSYIWLKPEYAEKQIKVEVVQKYTIEYAESTGIYTISDNIVSESVVEGKTKSTSTDNVAKGSLSISEGFKVYYNGGTEIVRATSALSASNITVTTSPSDVITKVHDSNDSNHTSAWTLSSLGITPEITFASGTSSNAPSSAAYYNAVLRASGYEDLDLTGTNGVFIKVKYAAPTSDQAKSILWKKGDFTGVDTAAQLDCIDKGKVAFKTDKVTVDDTTDGTDVTVYHGNKQTLPGHSTSQETAAAENSSCQMAVSGSLTIGFKNNGHTASDNEPNGNNVGYIADSDSTSLSTNDLSDYIGIREIIKSARIVEQSWTTGSQINVKAYDSTSDGQEVSQYSDINWTWHFGLSNVPATGAFTGASTTHRVTQANYNAGSGSLSVTGVRNYPIIGNRTITLSSTQIPLGTMTSPSISYIGASKLEGDTVTTVELSLGASFTTTDSISYDGNTINCTISNSDISTVTATGTSGSVSVTVHASGYNDATVTVGSIPIRQSAPSVSAESNALSTETGSIGIGYVEFASLIDNISYEYARVSAETLNGFYGSLLASNLNKVYGLNPDSSFTSGIDASFTSAGETSWHSAVNHEEFTKPGTVLSIRKKMKGKINGADAYYDSGTNEWRVNGSTTDVYIADTFATNGLSCSLKVRNDSGELEEADVNVTDIQDASAAVHVPYSTENDGTRGVSGFNVTVSIADMALSSSKSGGVVTISASNGYSVTVWRIDGMSVSKFMQTEGMSTCVSATTGTNATLVFTLSAMNEGTYQITAYGTDSNGIEYSANASMVVSK
ncbi:MAG: hypothetical protein K6A43_12240 [Treponema sp.]|nr:hypothetical protein [Treponema sp.]